eukprot:6188176-Pleurochrysis_carterae.AAC.1
MSTVRGRAFFFRGRLSVSIVAFVVRSLRSTLLDRHVLRIRSHTHSCRVPPTLAFWFHSVCRQGRPRPVEGD